MRDRLHMLSAATLVVGVSATVALVPLAISGAGSSRLAQPPGARTLVSSSVNIRAFALDGHVLGWVTEDYNSGATTLHLRALDTGRTVAIERIVAGSAQGDGLTSRLALADGRALWQAANDWSNQQYGIFTRTASIDDPIVHNLPCCDLYVDESRRNFPTFPLAGRGSALVYYAQRDGGAPPDHAVYRVVGRRAMKLFNVENPTYLAVDGERVAVVWGTTRKGQLRTLGGKIVAEFTLERRPRAIALSQSRLAVLTHGGRVELFSAASGSLLGSRQVPWKVAPMLVANDRWLVYAAGRAITGFDLKTGTSHLLAHAARKPFDLTVSGERVAWAEHVVGDGTRIRLALLPRS